MVIVTCLPDVKSTLDMGTLTCLEITLLGGSLWGMRQVSTSPAMQERE